MKKNHFLILFLLLVGFYFRTQAAVIDPTSLLKAKTIIKEVQQKYAPDRRTEIYNVSFSNSDSSQLEIETTRHEVYNVLKERFNQEKISIILNERPLPAKDLGDQTFGIANLSVCNNRFYPDNGAEMATQVILGTPVRILKKEHGYYLVQSPDRYIA